MTFLNFLSENWSVILMAVIAMALLVIGVIDFYKLPHGKRKEKIVNWLLFACTKAEEQLGSGTGKLKLAMVYDMFISKFPIFSKFISFEKFSSLVDEALEQMRKMLDTNRAVADIVLKGQDNNSEIKD